MDHILDLCQRIRQWDKKCPYEILSANKNKEDESLIRLVVRVRKSEETEENDNV